MIVGVEIRLTEIGFLESGRSLRGFNQEKYGGLLGSLALT